MYKNLFNFTALATPQKCQNEKNRQGWQRCETIVYTAVDIYPDFITWKNCLSVSTNVEHIHALSSFYS